MARITNVGLDVPTVVCKVEHVPTDATTYDGDPLDLLTVKQVAEFLKIEPESVYRLCSRGVLRSVKIGERTRRIRRDDLDAFIEERIA